MNRRQRQDSGSFEVTAIPKRSELVYWIGEDDYGKDCLRPQLRKDSWYEGECNTCGEARSILWCNQCAQVVYCSVGCQVENWGSHESECWIMPERAMTSWLREKGEKPEMPGAKGRPEERRVQPGLEKYRYPGILDTGTFWRGAELFW